MEMFDTILELVFFLIFVGLMLAILFQIFKIASVLFLLGIIGTVLLGEIYGIYLLFTETNLYIEDFQINGVWSFTGVFVMFNITLLFFLVIKSIGKSRIKEII